MDYQALLYNPLYLVNSVVCDLDVSGVHHEVRVIDKTAGVEVGDSGAVMTVEPAVVIRAAELQAKGLTAAQLHGAVADFNGGRWRVRNSRPAPSPKGEADGEYYLFLARLR